VSLLRHNASVYGVVRNDTNPFPSASNVSNGNIIFPKYAKFLTHRIYLYAIKLILVCSQLTYEEAEGPGSIPVGVINLYGRAMGLESTQPLTEMSTRDIS